MHKPTLLLGFLAFLVTAHANGDAAMTESILLTPTDLKWVPMQRPGTAMALAEGDPDTGPAHFYLKYEQGFVGGEHYHSSDHGGWILSGTVILVVDGKESRLPPGSFYFIAARKPHVAKCDQGAECIMTVDVRDKWDVVSVPAPAPGKRAIAPSVAPAAHDR